MTILLGGVLNFFLRDLVRILCILSFFFLIHYSCTLGLVTIFTHTLYLFSLYVDVCFFHLPLHVLFLFSLYTYVSYTCMQSIISVLHKDALMSFVESVSEIQVFKVYLP